MFTMIITDIAAAVFAGILAARYAPKTLFLAYGLMSVCIGFILLFFVFLPDQAGWYMPGLVAWYRFGVCAAFYTLFLTHQRYFPTLFSTTSMGLVNIVCRIAVIFAPIVAEMSFTTPLIVYIVLWIAATVSAIFISENEVEDGGEPATPLRTHR